MRRHASGNASLLTALFTSTSAVCVTGLVVVDTPTYWSTTGQVVIMGLIQVGGFGIMALTSLLALLVARRLGLRTRLLAQAETGLEMGPEVPIAGLWAVFFRDPDGTCLELIERPVVTGA